MLKKLLKKTEFISKIKKFYTENKKEILDVILFGSVTHGKENPADIDLLILYKEKENLDLNLKLKKSLKENVEITSKTYDEMFSSSFLARESFLTEGYSLVRDKKIIESFGFSSKIIFRYELKGLSKSDRMRFYYALYGRTNEGGIIKETSSVKFSERIIISDIEHQENLKEFFSQWKIEFVCFSVLMPKRVTDSKIFS